MEKDSPQFQVIIIGGGPAGLATSLTLSARGIRHCVVDAKSDPAKKAGEAIPPNAKPLFRQLGIEHLLEDRSHLPYYGNKSSWGDGKLRQEEFIKEVHGHGYLLNRLHFERQLRKLVETGYCRAFWGYRLKSVNETENNTSVELEGKNEKIGLKGLYIVDATGRKASVCRHLGITPTSLDQQFAITLHCHLESRLSHEIFIESVEDGWWYAAPFGENKLTLMYFTLRKLIPSKVELAQFISNQLKKTSYISVLVKNLKIDQTQLQIMPAGTSTLDTPVGKNWVAVGDAAYAYDPISSFGMTSGLGAGFYAGHALADYFSGKIEALNVYRYVVENAFQAYLEKLENHYGLEQRWPESTYWLERLKFGALQNSS